MITESTCVFHFISFYKIQPRYFISEAWSRNWLSAFWMEGSDMFFLVTTFFRWHFPQLMSRNTHRPLYPTRLDFSTRCQCAVISLHVQKVQKDDVIGGMDYFRIHAFRRKVVSYNREREWSQNASLGTPLTTGLQSK